MKKIGNNYQHLIGQRFGRLVIVARSEKRDSGRAFLWVARCDCGGQAETRYSCLTSGNTKSCGCLQRELAIERLQIGARNAIASRGPALPKQFPRSHASWQSMKERCSSEAHKDFKNYGGRGIKVCERWMVFANFVADMGERPVGMTIDRKNSDGNYEPGNCRWATKTEQARNRRNNTLLTHEGRSMPVAAWAEEIGLSKGILLSRIKNNCPLHLALTAPHGARKAQYPA